MIELTRKEEQILLAIHHLKDEAYLITIREQIHRFTGKYYSVGTIFAPLNRLDMNGYIESYTNRSRCFSSKKPIKFYRLTEWGNQALSELRRLHALMWSGVILSAEE